MLLDGKTVLITGGTGSLGKTLVRRILASEKGTPKKVIVFSRDEAKQHEMRLEYLHSRVTTDEVIYSNFKQLIEFRIGDVRNYADICSALKDAEIVINAAALKQVPVCEYFPIQAIMTNCLGAYNIIRAIEENDLSVETALAVSTDKAAKPINVMGMTKGLQERIFTSANILNQRTRFICVRYGNVLASRGSVIPLFHHQIRNGGPVTVTDGQMTRFLLSLDEAVNTVFAALEYARKGETFIPIVPSVTIINTARALIGNRDIEIAMVGTRPGEKMHEILISEEEVHHCRRSGAYYAIMPMLPELREEGVAEPPALEKEYSSADGILDLPGTVELLKDHRLMVDDVDLSVGEEFLR